MSGLLHVRLYLVHQYCWRDSQTVLGRLLYVSFSVLNHGFCFVGTQVIYNIETDQSRRDVSSLCGYCTVEEKAVACGDVPSLCERNSRISWGYFHCIF
jgi:hypothetical protein